MQLIEVSDMCAKKLDLAKGDVEVRGAFIKRGSRVGIVTNEGRVEWFVPNDWGGIDVKATHVLGSAR